MNFAINPLDRDRRPCLHRGHRRGLCVLQRGGVQPPSRLGRELELDLVHVVGVCRDQLYRKRRVRRICSPGIVAGRIRVGDLAPPRRTPDPAAPRSAVTLLRRRLTPFPARLKGSSMLGHNRKMSGAECLADMLKGYGVTHVFHVPAVLRKTFAVMETAHRHQARCTCTARRPRPTWPTAMRARRASPASAWRR